MAETAGDMAIKDLTPQTTNIGDRLVKNMRICGSGIYTYAMDEAPLLHLTPVPEKYRNLQFINVYRPADVLVANKEKFARVPIITGHHVLVNRDNAKQLTVGMVGDTVEAEEDRDGETYLYTTGTIVAGDGVDAYERLGQLSVGYDPIIEWSEGTHNGVPYQAELKGFNDVNHLLICKTARGGPQCMVMDSLDHRTPLQRFIYKNSNIGGVHMSIFSKIFGSKQAPLAGDAATVSVLLQSITLGADAEATVKKIREIAGDAIDSEMSGFLDELSHSKGESAEDVSKAVGIVDAYWKKISGDACMDGDESKEVEVKKDGDKKEVEVKKDGQETKKIDVEKKDGEKEVKVEEKVGGDSIDYEKLADMVAARLKPQTSAGDEAVDGAASAEALKQLSTAIAGDTNKDGTITSDSIMKSIWG